MEEGRTPQGVVAVLVAKDGRVVASSSDFDTRCADGFTVREAQARRAMFHLKYLVAMRVNSAAISEASDRQTLACIVDRLCRQKGYRLETIPVGYDKN